MGGYAAYVWSAFGLSFLILLINFILPLNTEKKILRQLKKKLERSKQKSMNPHRRKILLSVVFVVAGVGVAAAMVLKAFQENLLYFYSPTQVVSGEAPTSRLFRIGGMVVEGSLSRDPENLNVSFELTDTAETVTVNYEGILPDLFRPLQFLL